MLGIRPKQAGSIDSQISELQGDSDKSSMYNAMFNEAAPKVLGGANPVILLTALYNKHALQLGGMNPKFDPRAFGTVPAENYLNAPQVTPPEAPMPPSLPGELIVPNISGDGFYRLLPDGSIANMKKRTDLGPVLGPGGSAARPQAGRK